LCRKSVKKGTTGLSYSRNSHARMRAGIGARLDGAQLRAHQNAQGIPGKAAAAGTLFGDPARAVGDATSSRISPSTILLVDVPSGPQQSC
jgi:hypothetical protein